MQEGHVVAVSQVIEQGLHQCVLQRAVRRLGDTSITVRHLDDHDMGICHRILLSGPLYRMFHNLEALFNLQGSEQRRLAPAAHKLLLSSNWTVLTLATATIGEGSIYH